MKRYFGIIVAIIGISASIVFAMKKFEAQSTEAARDKNEQRIKIEYLERAAWVRLNPDEKSYRDEIGNLMTWYFKEVTDHLNRYQGNRNFDDYLQELEVRGKKTSTSKFEEAGREKLEEKKVVYEYSRRVFDLLKGKTYAPFWTATDKGIRFDLLSADTVRIGGDEKIHLPVVVWGLPRDERTDDHGVRRVTSNASFRFNWKLFDEKQKLVAEIPGDGGPDSRVDYPERFVKFFPPMALLGHYDLDKLPANVKTAEIVFSISARAPTGGDLNASFPWKLEVPAAWKLGPGETWKGAQDSIRPEDEINPTKKK